MLEGEGRVGEVRDGRSIRNALLAIGVAGR